MVKKIIFLLADDDSDDRDFFEKALFEILPEAELKTVSDGKKVIEYLAGCAMASLPTTVILDYNMPQLNGYKVLDWMCSRSWLDGIDKFVWSTAYQQEYKDSCTGKGAIEYFVKPATEEGFINIVKKIVDYSRLRGSADQKV